MLWTNLHRQENAQAVGYSLPNPETGQLRIHRVPGPGKGQLCGQALLRMISPQPIHDSPMPGLGSQGNSGKVAQFGVAVKRDFSDETDFFNVSVFGAPGESVAKWRHKGDGIIVFGSMQSRKKENVTYWNLVAQKWWFAENKGGGENASRSSVNDMPETMEEVIEDVPF